MTSDFVLRIFIYVVAALTSGGLFAWSIQVNDPISGDRFEDWVPKGGGPALCFCYGILWPLSVPATIGVLLGAAIWGLGKSMAVLWRAVRAWRRGIPRATARRRVP